MHTQDPEECYFACYSSVSECEQHDLHYSWAELKADLGEGSYIWIGGGGLLV